MSKTRNIAIAGVLSALSFTLMFMSSFMPLTYSWVMLSGFVVMVIVIEVGRKTALLAYIAVALMCFMLLPNIVILLEFALLIGYYPIIKMWLDSITRTLIRKAVKLAIFLAFSAAVLFVSTYILGIMVGLGEVERARFFILMPMGQIAIFCIAYDYALGHVHQYYITSLRPKIFPRNQ